MMFLGFFHVSFTVSRQGLKSPMFTFICLLCCVKVHQHAVLNKSRFQMSASQGPSTLINQSPAFYVKPTPEGKGWAGIEDCLQS